MIPALKFIGECLVFAAAMAVIGGWMLVLDALVGRPHLRECNQRREVIAYKSELNNERHLPCL